MFSGGNCGVKRPPVGGAADVKRTNSYDEPLCLQKVYLHVVVARAVRDCPLSCRRAAKFGLRVIV